MAPPRLPVAATALQVLQLPPDATPRQVRRAYLTLARRHHPDKDPSPGAKQRFQKIQDAYEALAGGPPSAESAAPAPAAPSSPPRPAPAPRRPPSLAEALQQAARGGRPGAEADVWRAAMARGAEASDIGHALATAVHGLVREAADTGTPFAAAWPSILRLCRAAETAAREMPHGADFASAAAFARQFLVDTLGQRRDPQGQMDAYTAALAFGHPPPDRGPQQWLPQVAQDLSKAAPHAPLPLCLQILWFAQAQQLVALEGMAHGQLRALAAVEMAAGLAAHAGPGLPPTGAAEAAARRADVDLGAARHGALAHAVDVLSNAAFVMLDADLRRLDRLQAYADAHRLPHDVLQRARLHAYERAVDHAGSHATALSLCAAGELHAKRHGLAVGPLHAATLRAFGRALARALDRAGRAQVVLEADAFAAARRLEDGDLRRLLPWSERLLLTLRGRAVAAGMG